jgi:hypothetical protein
MGFLITHFQLLITKDNLAASGNSCRFLLDPCRHPAV